MASPLPRFRTIVADPPWPYKTPGGGPLQSSPTHRPKMWERYRAGEQVMFGSNVKNHYGTLSLGGIKALPVGETVKHLVIAIFALMSIVLLITEVSVRRKLKRIKIVGVARAFNLTREGKVCYFCLMPILSDEDLIISNSKDWHKKCLNPEV